MAGCNGAHVAVGSVLPLLCCLPLLITSAVFWEKYRRDGYPKDEEVSEGTGHALAVVSGVAIVCACCILCGKERDLRRVVGTTCAWSIAFFIVAMVLNSNIQRDMLPDARIPPPCPGDTADPN
eukprot:Sspe_Gene.111264::Locus_92891_Transcript_1_1_Confidence_1.000_Length_578::g.111264::m.111264